MAPPDQLRTISCSGSTVVPPEGSVRVDSKGSTLLVDSGMAGYRAPFRSLNRGDEMSIVSAICRILREFFASCTTIAAENLALRR